MNQKPSISKKTTSIKVVVIDPYVRTVGTMEIPLTVKSITNTIGSKCELFELVRLDGMTNLLVDEEGLFTGHAEISGTKYGTMITGYKQPLFGRIIVCGNDPKDPTNFGSTKLSADGVRRIVSGWVQGTV
jgi:hypothetical protein